MLIIPDSHKRRLLRPQNDERFDGRIRYRMAHVKDIRGDPNDGGGEK